jgi:hypothetical protein
LLSRLAGYPEIKWITLREELRRLQLQHAARERDFAAASEEWAAFCAQKAVVERILEDFSGEARAPDAWRLLGGAERRAPERPRCHVVLHPREMQRHVAHGIYRLLSEHSMHEDSAESATPSGAASFTRTSAAGSASASARSMDPPPAMLRGGSMRDLSSMRAGHGGGAAAPAGRGADAGFASTATRSADPPLGAGEEARRRPPWWVLHESYWPGGAGGAGAQRGALSPPGASPPSTPVIGASLASGRTARSRRASVF